MKCKNERINEKCDNVISMNEKCDNVISNVVRNVIM